MSDDDIQVVLGPSRSTRDDLCQYCSLELNGLSAVQRDEHYEGHASEKPISGSRPKRGRTKVTSAITSPGKMTLMKSAKNTKDQENIFWYPGQAVAPPDNYSPGVLSILKEALKKSYTKGAVKRAAICYERTPHIFREISDSNWGCAYRNFLMACAALMDQQVQTVYHQNLGDPLPPGVGNLQHWIEDAWKHGYDDSGADELGHKLVGTKKKIGTGDLYVAFTSRRIPCMLVDFNIKKSPKGFDTLIEWVVSYFTEKPEGDVHALLRVATPVTASRKMPIIMQWDGHSITIVGYELGKNGKYNLLVFDPSSNVPKDVRQAALGVPTNEDWASSIISRGKSKHHGRSEFPAAKKRSRTSQEPEDIVSIPDSDDEKTDDASTAGAVETALDPDKVIKAFRLKAIHTKKHDYQLLYFTMGDPLSDQEQNDRKIVLSDRVY